MINGPEFLLKALFCIVLLAIIASITGSVFLELNQTTDGTEKTVT